jgi:hypothetical protein
MIGEQSSCRLHKYADANKGAVFQGDAAGQGAEAPEMAEGVRNS